MTSVLAVVDTIVLSPDLVNHLIKNNKRNRATTGAHYSKLEDIPKRVAHKAMLKVGSHQDHNDRGPPTIKIHAFIK